MTGKKKQPKITVRKPAKNTEASSAQDKNSAKPTATTRTEKSQQGSKKPSKPPKIPKSTRTIVKKGI